MKIVVKFFARYREALGVEELSLEGEFATVDDVRRLLLAREGAQVLGEQNLMCARNEDLCQLDEALFDGDEVAFFPTVTGG
ncbi:molybdopterin synthase sulfur carrier subunit [Pseudomonas agarici]|uniref:Molybdopterin synthase sulfur carrier subunit n=1 Tax=Pseudomonas agarici TaxID=46677 RepID=A0A0X1SX52_PSEAA|nr:MoaD/ThiS family protein [Pseudomonas agarici]AMB84443.1 molybdopterin synthase sulfur carrier subunit [Pseudomonas agarici]NWB89639.1 MoaD/ThiS family protein [Pseudomonas agarici]NWC10300.1 MoaD/ThiS family protein [Pseudomonas agarici]SEK20593.1 molybdopterin synthase subunit MoaD [Pseudomonas agarici]